MVGSDMFLCPSLCTGVGVSVRVRARTAEVSAMRVCVTGSHRLDACWLLGSRPPTSLTLQTGSLNWATICLECSRPQLWSAVVQSSASWLHSTVVHGVVKHERWHHVHCGLLFLEKFPFVTFFCRLVVEPCSFWGFTNSRSRSLAALASKRR